MIIIIGGEKGGPGKSTVAQNLSAYLTLEKKVDNILIDADPQGTTEDWIDDRNNNPDVKQIHCAKKTGRIHTALQDFEQRYGIVVVDVGGRDNEGLRSAMAVADLIVIPLRPKRRDLKTLTHMSELVVQAGALNTKLKARTLITQCPTLPNQATRILEAKEACESFGLLSLNAITYTRNVYDDIEENGLSVFESSDKKAIDEITKIGEEIFKVLEV
jgi:chromosome partitioning protein